MPAGVHVCRSGDPAAVAIDSKPTLGSDKDLTSRIWNFLFGHSLRPGLAVSVLHGPLPHSMQDRLMLDMS